MKTNTVLTHYKFLTAIILLLIKDSKRPISANMPIVDKYLGS